MLRRQDESAALCFLRICCLIILVCLAGFPFYWMIIASLKPLVHLAMDPLNLWPVPGELSVAAYKKVWFQFGFGRFFLNSLYVSGITVFLTIALATLAAYTIARIRFRGRRGRRHFGLSSVQFFNQV